MRVFSIVLLLCAGFSGCSGENEPLEPGSVTMSLGGAQRNGTGFVELFDGEEAELIPGSQGGFHVWINFRVDGLSPGELRVARTARRVSDSKLVLNALPVFLDTSSMPTDAAWTPDAALPSFMCPAPVGLNIIGETLLFETVLLDGDEQELSRAQIELVPRCPTGEQAEFCHAICSG